MKLMRLFVVALAVAWALVSFGGPALAEQAKTIWLSGDTYGVLADRLRAELGARGLELRAVGSFEPGDAIDPAIVAVLCVQAARERVEIWTPEADGSRTARFRAAVVARSVNDETVPVRVAEDLRAYLAPEPDPGPRALPPAATPPEGAPLPRAAAHPPAWSIGLDAALVVPTASLGAGAATWLRGRRSFGSRLAVDGAVILPIVPTTVSAAAGSASVADTLVGFDVYLRALGDGGASRWDGGVAAGAAGVWLHFAGTAKAPDVSRRDDVWTSLPFGALEIAREVAPHIWVRASLLAGFALPAVSIRFAGAPISPWGAPMVATALGARFDL